MLVTFLDYRGLIHEEIVPPYQVIHTKFYESILYRLIKTIFRNNPDLNAFQDWFLLHDNTPSHNVTSITNVWSKGNVTIP